MLNTSNRIVSEASLEVLSFDNFFPYTLSNTIDYDVTIFKVNVLFDEKNYSSHAEVTTVLHSDVILCSQFSSSL